MKIIVIGAAGDIGKAVCEELGARHDIITAGRSSGELSVDMADRASVDAMYEKAGPVDAVVSTAGEVHFGPLGDFTQDSFMTGLKNKVMGQVNLVLAGLDRVAEGGSFTLTTISACAHTSAALSSNSAPVWSYSASANPLPTPAPRSTTT